MEGGDSIVLEEEIDPNYEPTEKEVLEYATWLGMDLEAERDLFWIAREGLKAPLPENWKPCKTTDTEEIYYFNFATGQSTWDHPCDEFYRNLYEEHKQKRHAKDAQETDEKKKAKEDVAELLGRKSGGKKKKGALVKAEPLSGPTLGGKANPLEKKPLFGLSGRLGSLGSSGLGGGGGGGGLKPVAGLGPLKGEAKDVGGLDSIADNFKGNELTRPLSRTPLGSALGKKPLLSSSPSASMGTGNSKANTDADFEEKKRERLARDHAEKLREIQNAHDSDVEALRKKLKAQLEDVQDAEEMKLRREMEMKKKDLENQFDREENALQRSRKDQLKRLETENETAITHKKEDLDRYFMSETDKLRLIHETKKREIQEDFEQEYKELTDKMKSLIGEKKDAIQLAGELKAEIERLGDLRMILEQDLDAVGRQKDAVSRDKEAVEQERDSAQREVQELWKRLLEVNRAESSNAFIEVCAKCPALEGQVSSLKSECVEAHSKVDRLQKELIAVTLELKGAKRNINKLERTLRDREAALQQETAALEEELSSLRAESSELRTKLVGQRESSSPTTEEARQMDMLQKQLAAAHAEVVSTKNELSELQDEHAVVLKTNIQIKEQLMKESNERKNLHERLDLKTEQDAQEIMTEVEMYQQQVQALQKQVDCEVQAGKEKEDACDSLRREMVALEQAKRSLEASVGQLELDKLQMHSNGPDNRRDKERLTDLEKEKSQLEGQQSSLKQEVSAEKIAFLHDKDTAETQRRLGQREIEEPRKQLTETNQRDSVTEKCAQCSVWEDQVSSLKRECSQAHSEVEQAWIKLADLRQETEARSKAEREDAKAASANLPQKMDDTAKAFQDQEALLKREATALQHRLSTVEAESIEVKNKWEFLQAGKDIASLRESDVLSCSSVAREQLKTLERQLATSQAEVASLQAERLELQHQHNTLQSANAQTKDLLKRESAEKKELHRKLDAKIKDLTHCLAATTEKHQQQILSLQQQVESESRARRDRDDACDALRKEFHALEQAKRKMDTQSGQLESDKRHLESEKAMLALRLDAMSISRKRDEKSVISVEEALSDKRLKVEQLRANLRVVEVDKEHLETRMKVLNQELEQLQTKTHRLEAEHETKRARSQSMVKERDTVSQRHQSLVDELESSQRKRRALSTEVSELQCQLSKSKKNEQTAANKMEQSAQQLCKLEQQVERDEFATKMKLQQLEVELASVLHAKERTEMQLQARDKELAAAKDEVSRIEGETEALHAHVKSLLSDKEEVQAALLSANMANVASASANRDSAKSVSASTDVMMVKLQLADTDRTELKLHLADISAQLENSTRRCASLEVRCRDQSVEIESLHVQVASFRSASQRMHLSALESLQLVERLEYEHKKRTLRSDFLNQLRDFQEREEQALARHKARLRAQYERHLEDLVAELEKMRQQRVEQEEALSVHMIQQIRQERDVKRNEAKRQVREELKLFEQELHERKARDIEIICKAIERDEDELGARLREIRQVAREEELVKQQKASPVFCKAEAPASPGQQSYRRHVIHNQPESLDEDDDPAVRKRAKTTSSQTRRSDHRHTKDTKMYQKWKHRLQEEVDLLVNARTLVAHQRQGLTKQAQQLKASKNEWKRNSRVSEANPNQQEVKRMLDGNMANWSEGMRRLHQQEAWVKQREQKLAKIKSSVERRRRGSAYKRDNNLSGPSDSSSDEGDWSDFSNQSELASTLEKLERLDEDLASDAGGFSGVFRRQVDDHVQGNGFHPVYPPQSYAIQREGAYRYPFCPPLGYLTPRRAIHAAGDLAGPDSRWIRSQRSGFGLRSHRFEIAPISSSACHADQVYQQRISRWAKGREKVQHAATNHASWLSSLCEELKEYGAKYTRVDRESEDTRGGAQFAQEGGAKYN
ncbi:WW domain-containing protein [Phytophthora infestans]|uniref:WW domain-containing protein n=1 Tax=Phytophthora infestans TaxID=4787 RepID=A0A8S9UGR2_PHYIN|nr:WW domain-containing protein [Phytophthora infestans]